MKLAGLSALTSLGFFAGLAGAASPILINPSAQPQLPSLKAAKAAASAAGLDLDNVQADILIGMRKNKELFFFFEIANATDFKAKLGSDILQLVTSTTQILGNVTVALNIAFSHTGLLALNVSDTLGDLDFTAGQLANAANLGTRVRQTGTLANVTSILGDSITEVYSLQGAARPGPEQGHEHFGFQDGISNPAVVGFTVSPNPGQAVVPPGQILLGEDGDITRPDWAKDGSFLAFRQLKQLVPEFNKFLTDNPINEPGLTPQQGSDLLGARMVGRWKSGAPVFLAPMVDNPELGANAMLNNNFTFAEPGQNMSSLTDQTKCPFSAHIRKTRPRADLGLPENTTHHIVRGGIPYGPEVTADEAASNTTQIERGLAFVAYQSNLNNGFQFLQRIWANNVNFVHPGVGFDPIIGANMGAQRIVNGLDPTNSSRPITLVTDFVQSRGGEYFFSPSISAIATVLSV
ncbi:dye-decolorizing peroxidase precursor [Mycena epipterygia]|nr:dye-decolorizing peroxidase precursor [Mycena epipterygia]